MHFSRSLSSFLIASSLLFYTEPILAASSSLSVDPLCALSAPGYTTSRLTHSRTGKNFLIPLEEGKAVWSEQPENGGAGGKIVYFDGTASRVLTEQGIAESLSAAAPNKIVWTEKTGGEGSFRTDIFFFDGTRVARLTSPTGDITNYQPTVDASGKVAWVRRITDLRVDTSGATPQAVFGESRVMLFDGRTTQSISASGEYNGPKFFNGSLVWAGVETSNRHQNSYDDLRSVYLWKEGVLRSHVLVDAGMGEWPMLGSQGVVYGVQAPTSSEGMYRYYSWESDTTRDIGRYTYRFDPAAKAELTTFSWENIADSKTFFWTGSELKDVSRLISAPYQHLKTSDILSDGTKALYRAYTYDDGARTNGNPTWVNQVFTYDVGSNALTQFTNAPAPRILEHGTGAPRAWFGKNGEIYWVVITPEADYRTNDICYARPASNIDTGSLPNSTTQTEPSELDSISTEVTCSEEVIDEYKGSTDEAGQTLKQSSLAAFDIQVGYRLRATINKNRLSTVRTALNQARTKYERGLEAFITTQTRSLQTRVQNNPKSSSLPVIELASFDTLWANANRSLLQYANTADKATINRVLLQAKTRITNQYKSAHQQNFTTFKQGRDVCTSQDE